MLQVERDVGSGARVRIRATAHHAGVALILDIDLKLLEQPSVEDESVNSIAGSQRSLSARARSCTMCWPVSFFQRAPQRFILISNRLLQVASTLPVPSAKPSRRARA